LNLQNQSPERCDDCIVVVPCFNEAKRLDPQSFGDFLERTPDVTLLFVDDGSTDDTPLVLEQLRQQNSRQVSTMRLSSNIGKAEAVRQGIQAALERRPSMVGYWDADLATPLDAISRFREVLRARPELVLVMGSRVALMGRHIRRSAVRHSMGRVFATAASLIVDLPVYDTQCGAKLFRVTPATSTLFNEPFYSRWFFDVEILARMVVASRHGGAATARNMIYEYPLEEWRDVPGSRLRIMDYLTAGVDLAAICWRYRLRPSAADVYTPSTASPPESSIAPQDHR
jgi:glycosyltransferase involved in cell wall biosynthesis